MASASGGNGLSEESFRQLRVDFAEWYDRQRYLNMLKVLYRDHVENHFELDRATEVLDLLLLLYTGGNLSPTNLTIMYDTIKATQQFGFQTTLEELPLPNFREHVVSKFSPYRLQILALGMSLSQHDVKKLDAIYNEPSKRYEDCWCLIMDLENRMVLVEGDLEPFIDVLQRNGIQQAVRILRDDVSLKSGAWPTRLNELFPSTHDIDDKIRKYLFERQQILCRDVNRFTPAILNTRCEIDIADMFTDLDILKVNKIDQDAQPTTLEDVLHLVKSTDVCRVLVEGEGGIGKSTLLRQIAYNWAKDNGPFKDKILFLVNVRDIDIGEDVVDTIVKPLLNNFRIKTGLPDNSDLIKRFIANHDDDIVLLLDGLDELRNENQNLIQVFRKRELEKSKVILTSRSKKIDEFINKSDVHVKVKGFSDDNIKKYVKEHFQYLRKPALAVSLILELNTSFAKRYKSEFKHIEAIFSMCKNPLLLLLVCTIWEDTGQLPSGNTDLMKEVIRCILNQFINREDATQPKISRFEVIPQRFVTAMCALGKCMYKSLLVNQLSINKGDLQGNTEVVDLALNLGFVYQDSSISSGELNEVFTASHKLIIESLVGFYFYKQCTRVDTMEDDEYTLSNAEWNAIRKNEHLHNSRVFAIEFLGTDAAKMLNHWITNDFSTYRSLMAHLEFVKEEHLMSVENALSDHLTSSDFSQRYLSEICRSLRTIIRCVYPSETVPEDSSFINLMRRVYDTISPSIVQFSGINFHSFLKEKSFQMKGRWITHILLAVKDQGFFFEMFHSSILDDNRYLKYLTNECHQLNLNFDITQLNITLFGSISNVNPYTNRFLSLFHRASRVSNQIQNPAFVLDWLTDNVDGSTLIYHLLVVFHKLRYLRMTNCSLTGMNDSIRNSLTGRVQLEIQLERLEIDHSDFSGADGSVLFCLLSVAANLNILFLNNCFLKGAAINNMIRECLSRRVDFLNLQHVDISGNDLSNLDGSLLASLLGMAPNLSKLTMNKCCLTGDVINNMISNYHPIRRIRSELQRIELSDNDFSDIDGSLLANLLVMFPKLNLFEMRSCMINGTVINNMIREYYSRRNNLALRRLEIAYNYLSDIDCSLLSTLIRIAPDLHISMFQSNVPRSVSQQFTSNERVSL